MEMCKNIKLQLQLQPETYMHGTQKRICSTQFQVITKLSIFKCAWNFRYSIQICGNCQV